MPKIAVQKLFHLTGHKAAIFALAAGATEPYFYSGGGDGWIVRWDMRQPDPGKLIAKTDTQIFSLLFLKNENIIVAGDMNGGIYWIDPDQPAKVEKRAHHRRGVFSIVQVRGAVLTAGGDGVLSRWNASSRQPAESLHLTNKSLRSIAYSKRRNELAVGASDNSIYLLNAETLEVTDQIKAAHSNSVFSVRYFKNEKTLISGGRDAMLNTWSLNAAPKLLNAQPAHNFTINQIAVQPAGNLYATASRDRNIKIWSTENLQLLKVLESRRDAGHINSVNNLLWTPFQDYLVSCSDDRSIIIWQVKSL